MRQDGKGQVEWEDFFLSPRRLWLLFPVLHLSFSGMPEKPR